MRFFLLALLIIALLIAGGMYYLYKQVSYVPEWYEEQSETVTPQDLLKTEKVKPEEIIQKVQAGKRVELKEKDISALVLQQVEKKLPKKTDEFVKVIKTTLNENHMAVEAVIDLKKLPRNQIPAEVRKMVESFIESVPLDAFESFYCKIEGKPVRKNGKIGFDETATIQLGKITYPLKDMMVQASGKDFDDTFIPLGDLPFSNFILEEGKLILNP